jgi:MFS family permease
MSSLGFLSISNTDIQISAVLTLCSLNSMLIVFRFFAGTAGSCVITIGGGSFGDMFSTEERGTAMAIWAMGPLVGPVIGPVAGGFLASKAGWRWDFGLISIAASYFYTHYSRFVTRDTEANMDLRPAF